MRMIGPLATAVVLMVPLPAASQNEGESHWRNRSQVIAGRVLDARSDEPIEGMTVVARNVRDEVVGETLSDEGGRFWFRVEQPGLYKFTGSAFGYDSTATATLAVAPNQHVYVELRVEPAAFGLAPITVSAPRQLPYLESTGFYDRRRRGLGDYFDEDDIERFPGALPTRLLRRVPGVSVNQGRINMRGGIDGRPCEPLVVVDWVHMDGSMLDDMLPLMEIEAIEVYRGPAATPPVWENFATCGVVVVWTKH